MAVPDFPIGGDSLLSPVSPEIPVGTPLFEFVRVYESVPPHGFKSEFRPMALENFNENVEGDTTIDIIVSEKVANGLLDNYWGGAFSLIVSLISNVYIHRVSDRAYTEVGNRFSSYIYDSYYVKQIKQEKDSRNYRLVCFGLKEYLRKRLAIPAGVDTTNGVVSVPDGSQAAKPIPVSQILKFTNKTTKGITAGLISESKLIQDIPVYWTLNGLTGTMQRTYLLKDFRSIKEAIDNMLDDEAGPSAVHFDGGFGSRDNVAFFFDEGGLEKGYPVTQLSGRSGEFFKPNVETVENGVVNNIWTVGNASDGNIILGHKVQDGSTSQILLQEANTERNDIQTPDFLLSYTLGILSKSGASVRTMSLDTGLSQKMLLAFVGNYIYIKAPEEPQIDNSRWYITERTINMNGKRIEFDMVEVILEED